MTREEAIKIIDCYDIGFYDLSGEKIPADKLADAFDMAIEALTEAEKREQYGQNYETDDYVKLGVTDKNKDKVILYNAFGEKEYYPQTEPSSDLISRADAICEVLVNDGINNIVDRISALPSADAVSDDLIIKGAKGIKDGLYNITDGELFKYKAKGGTVRAYPIVPSADAVQGEWEHWGSPFSDESEVIDTIVCSVCGARFIEPKDEPKGEYNYCPNCGAKMKGGTE